MKRRYVISILAFAALAACVGLGLGILAMLSPPRPAVMKDDVDRIKVGMTLDEVTAILGPSHFNHAKTRNLGGAAKGVMHVWNVENPGGTVSIIINDADSRVVQKTFNAGERIPWWVTATQN